MLLYLVALCVVRARSVAAAFVNNARPRTDSNGAIVNAHQGSITWFPHLSRYLWVGSAFVPSDTPEDPLNGCANMTYGAPGFNNNPISMYASPSLKNDGWELVSADVLGSGRALGEYWEPNLVYNPGTSRFVMWYIYSKPNTTLGVVQAATSAGPSDKFRFSIANTNVSLKHKSFTSAELFVDSAAQRGTQTIQQRANQKLIAYVLYSSQVIVNGTRQTPAVIEQLDDTWTRTTGVASAPFGPSGEGEVMFERQGIYYMLEGRHCCFCRGGTDIAWYTASRPLGPYVLNGTFNPLYAMHQHGASVWHEFTLPCQQASVTEVAGMVDEHGATVRMWVGDGWQQAPDARKSHDPQWWVPLHFDRHGRIMNFTRLMNWTAE